MRLNLLLSDIARDIRLAWRLAYKNPVISIIVVLSLAGGVGASTLVYSAVDSVLLNPIDLPQPEELVVIWSGDVRSPEDRGGVAPADFLDWRARTRSFAALAARSGGLLNLSGGLDPERVEVAFVSPSLFRDVFKVRPVVGRFFTEAEDEQGSPVAVLSHGLWQRQFGGEPEALGRTVSLGGKPYTIVGVLPAAVRYPAISEPPSTPEVWLPLSLTAQQRTERGARYLTVFGRLRPGVGITTAQSEMTTVARDLETAHASTNAARGAFVVALAEQVTGNIRMPLTVIAGAVVLVLLITCVDIAALLLTAAVGRTRELAVRIGLGASPLRIARQCVLESMLLAVFGGLLGVALAMAGRRVVIALGASSVPALERLALNPEVLLFALVLTAITGIAFSVVPAIHASTVDVSSSLQESSRSSTLGRRGSRVLNAMVVAQFALSVTLLVGAGLLMRSFLELQRVDLGFRPTGILTFETSLPSARYQPRQFALAFDGILSRLRALPDVEAVGAVNVLPLGGGDFGWTFHVESRRGHETGPLPVADYRVVSPGYFAAMQIGLVRGRVFDDHDSDTARPVAVVSETMARRYWPNEDAIGRRVRLDGPEADFPWLTIVGVVRDVHYAAIDQAPAPALYRPLKQHPWPDMAVVIRTSTDPASSIGAIRSQMAQVDRDLPLANVQPVETVVSNSVALRRFTLFLIGTFAAIALILALAGIYGVISYTLSQRTQEFGVRMALGATGSQVLREAFWRGMRLVMIGVTVGTAVSLAFGRVLGSLLYRINAADLTTYVIVVSGATLIAACACVIPAWRAARTDPIVALRHS